VSYLIAADGMTVASSTGRLLTALWGNPIASVLTLRKRPRAKLIVILRWALLPGKGVSMQATPVRNRLGKVLGVVTMKKDLDEMETFFTKYPFCFLINPDGIIFMSSSPPMVLKSLWPLDKAIRDKLIASRQFGNELLEPSLFNKEIDDGWKSLYKERIISSPEM